MAFRKRKTISIYFEATNALNDCFFKLLPHQYQTPYQGLVFGFQSDKITA